jgi:hypothetical protein
LPCIVTETWFTARHTVQLLSIEGYVLLRKGRSKKKSGGVGNYVRNDDITCKIIIPHSDGHSDFTEILWIECCCGDVDYYIACCYHPPHTRYSHSVLKSEITRDLEMLINLVSNSKSVVIGVAGGFNSFNSDFFAIRF